MTRIEALKDLNATIHMATSWTPRQISAFKRKTGFDVVMTGTGYGFDSEILEATIDNFIERWDGFKWWKVGFFK